MSQDVNSLLFYVFDEYLHAAILLHNDVLDNAFIRRGRSSANKIWGEPLFKNGNASEKDYLRIIELVQDNGAINRCRRDAQDYFNLAEAFFSLFHDSPIKEFLLKLDQFIVNRSY